METKHTTIVIKSAKDPDYINLSKVLADFKRESKSMKTTGCLWVKMPSDLYTCTRKFADFEIYHVSFEEKYIILLYRYKFDAGKIPPNPNTTVGSHVLVYSKVKTGVKVSVSADGKVNMTGNVMKMSDKLGGNAKIKLVRFTPDFPRLGGLFTSKDVWFLVGLRVPYAKLKRMSSRIEDIKNVSEGWLTDDIVRILSSDSSVRYKNTRVYNKLPGSLIF